MVHKLPFELKKSYPRYKYSTYPALSKFIEDQVKKVEVKADQIKVDNYEMKEKTVVLTIDNRKRKFKDDKDFVTLRLPYHKIHNFGTWEGYDILTKSQSRKQMVNYCRRTNTKIEDLKEPYANRRGTLCFLVELTWDVVNRLSIPRLGWVQVDQLVESDASYLHTLMFIEKQDHVRHILKVCAAGKKGERDTRERICDLPYEVVHKEEKDERHYVNEKEIHIGSFSVQRHEETNYQFALLSKRWLNLLNRVEDGRLTKQEKEKLDYR